MELKQYGVGVTTINPGFVKTPLTDLNHFGMPFMVSAEDASQAIIQGLKNGDTEIHFPKRLSWPLKLLTALPTPLYERLARKIMLRQ
jgi:short-subunit dehydrogenase